MTNTAKKLTVAVGSDFLSGFARIPRNQQAKVLTFINKFRADPTLPGIHYEKLKHARDPNLCSVRIDQAYRGIVLRPEGESVYVLLWVDNHDKAYDWARNKVCSVHPETGSLQVIPVEEGAPQIAPAPAPQPGLFDGFDDSAVTSLGVPALLLPVVRSMKAEADLDRLASDLPQEAAEALYMLAAGYTLDEVRQEMDLPAAATRVDPQDFATALGRPDSKRRFFVVEDEQELAEMLNAPLEKWRVFLHPSQRKLVENDWNGPVRVLGGAGTGKTVVAMHRAKWLATRKYAGPDDRILFTTFTRNLAADIRDNLAKICPDDAMKRIEVVNLDRWVDKFLRANGYGHRIVYDNDVGEHWKQALLVAPPDLGLGQSFYREEWELVIQPQSAETLEDYQRASRVGRGTRLSRKQRKQIWPVFEEYRAALNGAGLREAPDAMRDASRLLGARDAAPRYKAVVVDEAQDMGPQAFALVRALLPRGEDHPCLFIVGDAHQRIYRHKVVLSRCGIDIRGRGKKLRINYRTTEETRRWAVRLLDGMSVDDLDDGADDQKGYRSLLHGVEPQLGHFASFDQEVAAIHEHLGRVQADGAELASCCLVTRTHDLLDQYAAKLGTKGIKTYRVRRSEPEDRRAPGLRLATMHRVKGLEFDHVIIASVRDAVVPLDVADLESEDPVVRREAESHERALLHVAATRAKKEVLVTGFGKPSRFLVSAAPAAGRAGAREAAEPT
ncbi:MAG: UvrD-helicase domain-containing protein [Deltaproteobacteria bacterium]|nr:UvrD-helicase domain-containing protein [Deltaproteobacteria bacterium]